jgi:hypothetical protein
MYDWPESLLNSLWKRRKEMYAEGREKGALWLLECRDLWDFGKGDEDGGVFFHLASTESEVDAILQKYEADTYNKVDGIFSLVVPLGLYHDIPPDEWRKGIRNPRAR